MKLADLFSEVELDGVLVRARCRVIEGFHRAMEPNPRRLVMYKGGSRRRGAMRWSGNAIVDCADGKVSTLAHSILSRASVAQRAIITADVFAGTDLQFSKGRLVDNALARLNHELVSIAIIQLIGSNEIYFIDGVWQVLQSTVNEYKLEKRQARKAVKSIKDDRRTYHGRDRGQTRRRGVPAGTSIGLGRMSQAM